MYTSLTTAAALIASLAFVPAAASQTVTIGLDSMERVITGTEVPAAVDPAPTVVLLGGLVSGDGSAAAVRAAATAYNAERPERQKVRLIAVPLDLPSGVALQFPPAGVAYRERTESHVLWRWLGALAPDLVLVAGADAGLLAALAENAPAGVGRIPARRWDGPDALRALDAATVPPSAAHRELDRRRARTPRAFALELGEHYGRTFDQPWYIEALALIAQMKLGRVEEVQRLAEPYVSGARNSLDRPNSLVMAGHILFTELARATGDQRYVAMVRKVADLGFDQTGALRESMPYHNEFSDSIFMGTVIAAQAGALTGERKYFDLAVRHLEFMQRLVLRPDGLYRHQPATDAAWGRGNGFAALGLILTLGELPRDHPGYARVLASYRAHMAALLPHQTRDGLWRNVVDVPGAYPELSGTAMIGFALQRGLTQGLLEDTPAYRTAVARAWDAVKTRTGPGGAFIDVCESTARIETLSGYLQRAAILGSDPRGGAMALLFATELMTQP